MDICIISGDAGCRKPSREIYSCALQKTGAEAGNCVFVDDRDRNLIPARALGMHAIRFVRDETGCCLDGVPAVRNFTELITAVEDLW